MPAPMLRLSSYAARCGVFHIARLRIRGHDIAGLHSHDFPELFWVEGGSGRHLLTNDPHPLAPGDLIFLRPSDEHTLVSDGGVLTIINLALAPSLAADLASRYCPPATDPWHGPPIARRHRLGECSLRRLGAQVDFLAHAFGGPRERLAVDRFLLELLDCLAEEAGRQRAGPEWLQRALAALAADPQRLAHGAAAFHGLCPTSREHAARTLRQITGESPRELVNRLRLERAALALRMEDQPIVAIALDAGFDSLSYFYRRFVARFGCTPRAYRALHHGTAGPDSDG